MNLKDPLIWTHIYSMIRQDLGYDEGRDSSSASTLSLILQGYGASVRQGRSKLAELISGNNVLVVGASPECLNLRKFIHRYDVVIAADGALKCCLSVGVVPEVVVTDLDGLTLKELSAFEGVIVVHAHGDNLRNIINYVPRLGGEGKLLVGTHQSSANHAILNVFGGFTDGDRAAYIAKYLSAGRIGLIGFNFTGVVGRFSKPYLRSDIAAWPAKRRKLYWAGRLISLLRADGGNAVECHDCKGLEQLQNTPRFL